VKIIREMAKKRKKLPEVSDAFDAFLLAELSGAYLLQALKKKKET
jgi:hypothetical protein